MPGIYYGISFAQVCQTNKNKSKIHYFTSSFNTSAEFSNTDLPVFVVILVDFSINKSNIPLYGILVEYNEKKTNTKSVD